MHPFAEDESCPLVLGGVHLPGERGLAGHSDADVIAHAISDALLGAAALGDLGELFPDTDPQWKGIDSLKLLAEVMAHLDADGWSVVNVDCSVVLEAPKLKPHKRAMELKLGAVVRGPVSVKAKRAEGLGAIGRGEGVACWAVALLEETA